ncbi:DinB family protein (plasmid) [Deinococcus sp. KNUC1210]|uniref:DinB family protein n=1 Tax=Deinococcus sp. KNUC1210 TaxID=2917691 RepID=UPI001EF05948|nr:DinB family protein [Deinococcus sp. KNUC1210]ULH14168.1 DinB family protein [Deinococcus sp. KNUC1210]
MTRPLLSDYPDFYARYVDLVPEDDILAAMQAQAAVTRERLLSFADRPDHRYAPEKWSVRQMLGHMTDTERVFGFRALWFARTDPSALPGFEQDDWMQASDFSAPLEELLTEFETVRRGHILFLKHLSPEAWDRRGIANGYSFSVRAYAYGMLGHERSHLKLLEERYSQQP